MRTARSKHMNDWRLMEGLDYGSDYRDRRTEAIIGLFDTVKSKVRDFCPNAGQVFSLKEEWAEINTFPNPAYDYEEHYTYSILAAAIWILDQIKKENKIVDLQYLLKPADDDLKFNIPPIWDPCHDIDLITSMVETLHYRNIPDVPAKEKAKQIFRPYLSKEVTMRVVDQSCMNRSDFNSILDLRPKDAIDAAVSRYESIYWDFVDRYFRSRAILVKEAVTFVEGVNTFNTVKDNVRIRFGTYDTSRVWRT